MRKFSKLMILFSFSFLFWQVMPKSNDVGEITEVFANEINSITLQCKLLIFLIYLKQIQLQTLIIN